MYRITIVANGEYYQGEDVVLDFETYNEACKYAKKAVESLYVVEIMHIKSKED